MCCSRIFLNDFEVVSVFPVITGITFVFTLQVPCISVVSYLYFRITFVTAISISSNMHVPFSLSRIVISGLLLGLFI